MNKVAICIPCYNSINKLKKLLDSIVTQTFKNFIVIITDDSENNLIKNLINEYFQINIQYYKNNVRLGATCNTNQALSFAYNLDIEYIKIMHHDDYFTSSFSLEKMVNALENNKNASIAFSSTYEVKKNIIYERIISDEQIDLIKEDCFNLVYGNIIGAPSATIIRKNDLLLDEHLKWFVDIEWYIQIMNIYKNFVFINEPLISIGLSSTQLSQECINNPLLILNESIYLYKKYKKLHCENYMNVILENMEKVINQYNIYQINDKNIYIYGAGEKGKECATFLEKNNILYKAFIVSDGKKIYDTLYNHNIIEFSEYLEIIKKEKSIIILALNEKNRMEIKGEVEKTKIEYIIWK